MCLSEGRRHCSWDFSHTAEMQPPPFWWMVDLTKVYSVGKIKLYNREDCLVCRKLNFHLRRLVGPAKICGRAKGGNRRGRR